MPINRDDFFNENFNSVNADRINVRVNDGFFGVTKPVTMVVPGAAAQEADNYSVCFFTADRSYEVILVTERHETAGSDGGTVTVTLEKLPSGTASTSGVDIITSGIDLKATANTNQTGIISQARTNSVYDRRLAKGDSLSIYATGTLTAVVGVSMSVLLRAI